MDFEFLFGPVEHVDEWLTGLIDGAPLVVALGIAFVLGLRHASDPDHLVAVTSLVAADGGDTRRAAGLGAWWGLGHAGALLAIGIPLIAFKTELPAGVESAAEKAIGVAILLLALRVIFKWVRGDFRASAHEHADGHARRRHLRRGSGDHAHVRSPAQAVGIGALHGLAVEATLALAVFAPMSIVSMAACTAAFAWVLTRPIVEPVYRTVLIPGLGLFGVMFGLWYAGLA
jgi:high-affinity nickel permease